MLRFQNPEYFWYLLLAVCIFFITLWAWSRSSKLLSQHIHKRLVNILTLSIAHRRRRMKLFLQLITCVLMVAALARPQFGIKTDKVKVEGIEMIIALDVSNSMLAEDVKPNRLELAKKTVERLLSRLSGHRVGLLAFAGNPALISPLTVDYSAIQMFVEGLSTDSVSTQGTNFKDTLRVAFEAFRRGGEDETETSKITRAILFLSDGEDQEQGALDKARDLVSQGIRIFTIGLGTEKGGPIPIRDERGNLSGYKQKSDGQPILSQVNTDFLQELAKAGGGGYYHATFSGDEISLIEEDLSKLEKAEFESSEIRQYDEKFQIPLLLAVIFCFLELVLGEKRKIQNVVQIYRSELKSTEEV